jgi:transposase
VYASVASFEGVAMALVDHRHKNGTIYVYRQHSVWDKEKKRSKNEQVCIGKRDPKTGEIIYNRRFSDSEAHRAIEGGGSVAHSVVIGPSLIMEKAAKDSGVLKGLSSAFAPHETDKIVSLAFAVCADSAKMYHAESWMETHSCPCHDSPLDSPDITRFLETLDASRTESFLVNWMRQTADEKGYYCFDITSVSSYAKRLSDVEWGYNRDKERLPQINVALLCGIGRGLPAFYEKLPGSLSDVCTIHKLEERLKKYGLLKIVLLLDRGFLSEANMAELIGKGTKFIMPLKGSLALSMALIDSVRDSIEDGSGIIEVDSAHDFAIYAATKVSKLAGRRIWYHVYFDTLAKNASLLHLFETLAACERELKEGDLDKSHAELYKRYFSVTTTPKRGRQVKRNMAEINKYKTDYAGFWVIATNAEKDAKKALSVYRKRNEVECQFKDLKDELDFDRLRMHSDATLSGRLFIQFIALVLYEQIRKVMAKEKLIKAFSVSEMFRYLGSYHKITFTGKYRPIISTPTKKQKKILDAFGIAHEQR